MKLPRIKVLIDLLEKEPSHRALEVALADAKDEYHEATGEEKVVLKEGWTGEGQQNAPVEAPKEPGQVPSV